MSRAVGEALGAPAGQHPQGDYLASLDGWRAVAILLVMVSHARFGLRAMGVPEEWCLLVEQGRYGVDVFFAISGLLITSRLLEERRRTGTVWLTGFYIRRAFRLLPASFVFLGTIAMLSHVRWIRSVSETELIASVFFFRNYLPRIPEYSLYTSHFWSLAVEEHFYALWPLVLRQLRSRSALLACIFGIATVVVWRSVAAVEPNLALGLRDVPFDFRTDLRLDGLLWGCALALALDDATWGPRIRQGLRASTSVLAVIAFLLLTAIDAPQLRLWQGLLLTLAVGGTVLSPGSRLSRLLESAVLRWIGRLSYSLYLWQQLFLVGPESSGFGVLQRLPQSIIFAFAAAVVSYHLVEKPFLRVAARLLYPASREGRATTPAR